MTHLKNTVAGAVEFVRRWFAGLSLREKVFAVPVLLVLLAPVLYLLFRPVFIFCVGFLIAPLKVKFLLVATAMSLFYGFYGPRIFPHNTQGWPWQMRLHVFWVYFTGAAAGWLMLYYAYFVRFAELLPLPRPIELMDFLLLLVAVIGITGHLPI